MAKTMRSASVSRGARSKRVARSAISGRYVASAEAARSPRSTTTASYTVSSGDPVTLEQQAAAARIRITADRKLGRKTPPWIETLARSA